MNKRHRNRLLIGIPVVLVAAFISALFLVSAAAADQADYKLIDLGTLSGMSIAYDINARGQVVGESTTASYQTHAFLWEDGEEMVDLGTLGGNYSGAREINNGGQIVGTSAKGYGSQYRAVIWEKGAMTEILPEGWIRTDGYAINNRGQVAGTGYTASADQTGFLWDKGTFVELGTLFPGMNTIIRPEAINDRGQVVGWEFVIGGPQKAFLWENGEMNDLGAIPGGTDCAAFDINNHGQVVGHCSFNPGYTGHAFLWQDGEMTDLGASNDPSPYANSVAWGISDRGQVVGRTTTTWTFHSVGFVWAQGEMIDLSGFPGWEWAEAQAVNNAGQVVGVAPYNGHAVMWQPIH